MNQKLYRDAFRHAIYLSTKHIWLLPFGIFAALLGQMGLMELMYSVGFFERADQGASNAALLFDVVRGVSLSSFTNISFLELGEAVWIFAILGIIFAFLTFVAVSSQGAIIHAAAKFINHKNKLLHPASKSWHVGVNHAGRIFGLNVAKKAVLVLLSGLIAWVSYRTSLSGALIDQILLVVTLLASIVIGAIVSFYVIYAACYVVVEEQTDRQALASAWNLLKKHPLVSLEVGATLILFNIFFAIFAASTFFLFLVPAAIFWLIGAFVASKTFLLIAFYTGLFLFIITFIFLGGMFTIFSTATWTYLFMKMHKKGVVSHIARLFSKN